MRLLKRFKKVLLPLFIPSLCFAFQADRITGPIDSGQNSGDRSEGFARAVLFFTAAFVLITLSQILTPLLVGIPQWLALRRQLPKAWLWIPGRFVSGIVLAIVTMATARALAPTVGLAYEQDYTFSRLAANVTIGVVEGAATGAVLVWLFRMREVGHRRAAGMGPGQQGVSVGDSGQVPEPGTMKVKN